MEKVLVKLDNVSKKFDKDYVIKDFSLDIYEGEFLTLLGPSGCGKTTVLRMISGLETVTTGKVYIDSVDVTNLDATKREVNTIFQNLALFPKMTVTENISFGLKMKKMPENEINKKVRDVIKLVKLNGLEDRYPGELSGGQQQRVAIARGIVMNPKVLLLDESLCSLDLKLKKSMQVELKKIQKKSGITFIYVTHDQDEALTMSDRIIIIENGVIKQDGSPQEIYQQPNMAFVADFIGESNILNGIITSKKSGECTVKINNGIKVSINAVQKDKVGDKVKVMIRPENIALSLNPYKEGYTGVVKEIVYDGSVSKLVVEAEETELKVNVDGDMSLKEGQTVYIKFESGGIVPIRGRR